MKLKLACLLLIAAIAGNATAQDKAKTLDQYFTALAANNRFNGNILVAENGKVVYEHSFGYADFSSKRPNTALSSFPIASITKTITATAILQLKEKGKLQLTDAVTKYLPDFPYPNITITHLLSHNQATRKYEREDV